MKYYLVIIPLLFVSLVACINQPPTEVDSQNNVGESTPIVEAPAPALTVSQETSGPNEQIFVEGNGFPANQVIVFYYADSETNLGPAVAQIVSGPNGDFVLELLTPTAWPGADFRGETRLLVVAEAADEIAMASAPIVIEYEDALVRYENSSAGYAVEIPAVWETTDAQITPLGELIMMGPEPISPGNPSNSMVISVDPTVVDEAAAAQYLICGSPNCTDDIAFNITTINGLEARSLVVGSENTPDLEWFFVRYEDRLIYFTLHDPLTLETLDGLVQSFSLIERLSTEVAAVVPDDSSEPSEADVEAVEPTLEPTEATETAEPSPTEEPSSPTPTETLEVTVTTTVEATATAKLTSTPTSTATATESPTETTTATATASPSPTKTATVVPTGTATATSSPTAPPTQTSTATLTATATSTPDEEPTNTTVPILGPLQTSLDLLTIMSKNEEDNETLEYFTQNAQGQINSPDDIQSFFKLDRAPFAFAVERLQGAPTVRVEIETYIDSPIEIRDLEFVLENGRWRVDSVSVVEPEGDVGDEPGDGDGSGSAGEEGDAGGENGDDGGEEGGGEEGGGEEGG